jgi:hypothetical protein
MGQTEHRAWKEMKEAQGKAKRNPSYYEEAKDAEIEWYKAKEEERKEEENCKKLFRYCGD